MSTSDNPMESHWDALRAAAESGGAESAIAYINGVDDPDRLKLYYFAQGALGGRDWSGKNFDTYIAVTNAGINLALERSATAASDDAERAAGLKDTANIMSYNLSANLAECWPGDDVPRERRHFEEGLRAAENCIRWREELNKPPGRRALGFWAKGMHALSLRELDTSVEAFARALECGVAAAAEAGKETTVSPAADFQVLLNSGYLGIAEVAAGIDGGAARYGQAIAAFGTQAADDPSAETREDAAFGLQQLQKVAAMFGL